jgi:hypothetical protein
MQIDYDNDNAQLVIDIGGLGEIDPKNIKELSIMMSSQIEKLL